MNIDPEGLARRSTRLALPKTVRVLEQFLLGALRLDRVTCVEVTPTSVTVERYVEPDGEVLTPALKALHAGAQLEPDLETLVQCLKLEALVFDPEGHILHLLLSLFDMVKGAGFQPVALFARCGDELPAALGLPTTAAPQQLFGVPVVYVEEGLEEGSILLVGSSTPFLADATYGVVADIGGVT